jgi:ribosomal protein S14
MEISEKMNRCNRCDEKKEIVFEKEGFRLCKECLDEFMKEHRFD